MIKYLGEDKKPFLLSYTAFLEFEKIQAKNENVEMVELFAFCGFQSGYKKEGKEFTAKPSDMVDWFDEDLSLFAEVMDEVAEALPKYKESQKKMLAVMQKLSGPAVQPVKAIKKQAQPGKKSKK